MEDQTTNTESQTTLAQVSPSTALVGFNPSEDEVALIKAQICVGASDNELSLFLHQARRTGLDPLSRQIYAIRRGDKMQIQTAIDGFRLIAERTGKYAGQQGPFWCGEDGVWHEVWTKPGAPVGSKVGVKRKDFEEVVWGIALFREFQAGGPMWTKMPSTMLAKCAEAQALRKAFPQELSSLYTADEMEQAGPIDAEVVGEEKPAAPPKKEPKSKATPVAPVPTEAELIEAESKAHSLWFTKEQGGTPAQWARLVRDNHPTKPNGLAKWQLVKEARAAGCTTAAEVLLYVEEDIVPSDAPDSDAEPSKAIEVEVIEGEVVAPAVKAPKPKPVEPVADAEPEPSEDAPDFTEDIYKIIEGTTLSVGDILAACKMMGVDMTNRAEVLEIANDEAKAHKAG